MVPRTIPTGWRCGKARKIKGFRQDMRIVAVTTDPVRLSFLQVLLADAGIAAVVLDSHISAIEGGIGAFPRRLAVATDDAAAALRVLRDAGEAPP